MATLAEAVDAAETDWLVSADIPDTVDYLTVESEVVQVTATFPAQYQARDGSTSDPRIRVVRAAGGTTAASHAGGTTLTPLIPPAAGGGGAAAPGTVVVTPPNEVDIGAALDASIAGGYVPDGSNPFITANEVVLANFLANDNDAGGEVIANLGDPSDLQEAATKNYVDTQSPVPTLAAVLLGTAAPEFPENADGNDTGGVEIVHIPAVDVAARAGFTATASGTGSADTVSLASAVDGDAVAGPRAEATGTGDTDACTYARSVDGNALADNDAAATGSGTVDAGCYAVGVDGDPIFAGAVATATGSGNPSVRGTATANTGTAAAGSLAVRGSSSAGMSAIVDGTSARMAFNGTTPIARPELPATPDAQDIADVLVALGLVTQGV